MVKSDCEQNLSLPTFAMLSINCYLLGDHPSSFFTVEISETKNVSILKDLIKKEMAPLFNHVDSPQLVLWKVDFPFANFQVGLSKTNLSDNNALLPLKKLSEIFSALNSELEHIHIIIKPPPENEDARSSGGETEDSETEDSETEGSESEDLGIFDSDNIRAALRRMNYQVAYVAFGVCVRLLSRSLLD